MAFNWLKTFLFKFTGEDSFIIRKCNNSIQRYFSLIGLFVIVIFSGCWLSASSFISELLDGSSRWLSAPIGILWALLMANMYLLLLYTISPTLLPVSKEKRGKRKNRNNSGRNYDGEELAVDKRKSKITPSLVFRIVFISFLAIIIAQPLNVVLLSSFAERSLSNYKTEYRINMMIVADSSLIKQELKNQTAFYQTINTKIHVKDSITVADNVRMLNDKVAKDQIFLVQSKILLDSLSKCKNMPFLKGYKKSDSLRSVLTTLLNEELESDSLFISNIDNVFYSDRLLQSDFNDYRASLKKTVQAKIYNYEQLEKLLENSNFYVKRIQILLSEFSASWIITLVVCGIFLLPIYWKFSIRIKGDFYEKKEELEKKLVKDNYKEFVGVYSQILDEQLREYSKQTWINLIRLLHTYEHLYPDKVSSIAQTIKNDIQVESVYKYEYWANPPFRTVMKQSTAHLLSEKQLLSKIYLK